MTWHAASQLSLFVRSGKKYAVARDLQSRARCNNRICNPKITSDALGASLQSSNFQIKNQAEKPANPHQFRIPCPLNHEKCIF